MKNYLIILLFLFLTACAGGGEERSKQKTDTEYPTGPVCYHRITGDKNRDSSFLRLEIKGDEVTGIFEYTPYEKDARRGIVRGKVNGDIITARWMYMQEGMNDTIPVSFKLHGQRILQQPNVFDPYAGKEVLDEKAAYDIEYVRTDCQE